MLTVTFIYSRIGRDNKFIEKFEILKTKQNKSQFDFDQRRMEMNAKLIQYSLDLKSTQSRLIETQHNLHLRKLLQINRKSNFSKIKRQAKSLKNLSQNMIKNKLMSRNFKQKQLQEKRVYNDLKMIRSMSQIHHKKMKDQKQYTDAQKDHIRYLQRKQISNKIVSQLQNKKLEQENYKIALRINRQQNDFSYVKKIRKQLEEYQKIKHNITRIKQDPTVILRIKKGSKLKKTHNLLTQNEERYDKKLKKTHNLLTQNEERYDKSIQNCKGKTHHQKFKTEVNQNQLQKTTFEGSKQKSQEIRLSQQQFKKDLSNRIEAITKIQHHKQQQSTQKIGQNKYLPKFT